jgi:DNA-binding GntR family transcriptional regulator
MPPSIASLLSSSERNPLKLERTLLKAQVADLLRTQIIQGAIPPGTALVERDLANALQISRIPVRDALLELEKEGLVVCNASNRRSVIQLTRRDIEELYELRLQLETLAVERAARNTSPESQQQLDALLEKMVNALEAHDDEEFPRCDVELHRAIWAQADNRHLEKMLHTMSGQLFMFASINTVLYAWDEVVDLHRDLVACINRGDVDGARASIQRHMQNSLDRALNAFRDNSTPREKPTL